MTILIKILSHTLNDGLHPGNYLKNINTKSEKNLTN